MSRIRIFNENCFETIDKFIEHKVKIDTILTSPPYNTGRPSTSERARENNEGRYDIHLDNLTQKDYCEWCVELFNKFDFILQKNGTILWNMSYGSDGTVNTASVGLMWLVIADIIRYTNFTIADRIIWKKKTALPNNVSPNKLTRIVEDVFIFVRKDEYKTFNANKEISSVSKSGQTFYKNTYNFIEAKNNDGACKLNKATFSSDLCKQLLSIYSKENNIIYDPFGGTMTTAIACHDLNMRCYCSELSEEQVKFGEERLEKHINKGE